MGLVAMKTSAAAVPRYEEFEKEGLSKQVVAIKATMTDERIHVVVSQMENVDELEQNVGAAKDRGMSQAEWDLLERYAQATDHLYCRGCGHLRVLRLASAWSVSAGWPLPCSSAC